MNISRTASVVIAFILACALGCAKKSDANQPAATQTIAPAAAQPSTDGTDAMTGTVDVDDGRSENEGGVLTDTQAGKKTETAGGAHKASAKKGAKASSKKP